MGLRVSEWEAGQVGVVWGCLCICFPKPGPPLLKLTGFLGPGRGAKHKSAGGVRTSLHCDACVPLGCSCWTHGLP